MDWAEAKTRLEAMTAADVEPTLSDTEITTLLDMSKLADAEDLAPSNTDWTPTFDLNRAAAEGWTWKAGKATAKFDFSADGAHYARSQVVAQCERMALTYRRRIVSSVLLSGGYRNTDDDEADEDDDL